ncbi:MAG: DNA-methyltransferase [Thermoanaerobaculia bacterium]
MSANKEMLERLLVELKVGGADLELTGFTGDEITALLVDQELLQDGLTDPDAIPAPPDEPATNRGDLIILGAHRLLCGDAGAVSDVERLIAGNAMHLIHMDPPYNVNVEPRSNNAIAAAGKGRKHHQGLDLARHPEKARPTGKMRARDRVLENDFLPPEEFEKRLLAWFGNAASALEPGRSFYCWGGYANCANYPGALKAAGLYFSQAVIWVKEWPVLTRKDFMGNHEWCFYGWKEGAAHYFHPGINNATDVWSVKKISPNSMVHLTEKPVELAERAIRYSSRPGEHVLDLFGGSGSTLIAAERMGRKAFLMEIDPAYCDVIVERWQEFTGQRAEGWRGNSREVERTE